MERLGTDGDRDPRRWGKRETIPTATLWPAQRFEHEDGQRWGPFYCSVKSEGPMAKSFNRPWAGV